MLFVNTKATSIVETISIAIIEADLTKVSVSTPNADINECVPHTFQMIIGKEHSEVPTVKHGLKNDFERFNSIKSSQLSKSQINDYRFLQPDNTVLDGRQRFPSFPFFLVFLRNLESDCSNLIAHIFSSKLNACATTRKDSENQRTPKLYKNGCK